MIITKIELENITTHKKTTIEFQQGLNLLYGQNGTGKSTVLNMIGYVLFDFLPVKNQKSLIRKCKESRAKTGKIKITIVGLNDEVYIIQRSLAKASPFIEVVEARTNMVIPSINNTSNLREWMAQQLELPHEIDLRYLFNTSIGVPQGTFTAPFLETPRNRTKFFNPILQVHVYKDVVWQRLLEIEKLFKADINEAEKKESGLEGQLKPKEELMEKRDALEKRLSVSKEDLRSATLEFTEINEQFNTLKKHFEDLNNSISEITHLSSEEKIVSDNNIALTKRFEKAKKSNIICSENKVDFEQYETLIEKQKALEEKSEKFSRVKDQISELSNQITEIDVKCSEFKRQADEIVKSKSNLSKLEKDNKNYKLFQELFQEKKERVNSINRDAEELEKLKTENIRLNGNKIELESKLVEVHEIEDKIKDLEKVEDKSHALELEITSLETEIKKLEDDEKNSKGGMCPILKEICLNIKDREFADIFQEKSELLKIELKPKKQVLIQLKKQTVQMEKLKQRFNKLIPLQGQLEEIKNQILQKGKNIKAYTERISKKPKEEEELENLKSQIDELEPNIKAYNILIDKIEKDLPKLNQEIEALNTAKKPLMEDLFPLQKERDLLKLVPEELIDIKKKLEPIRENYNKYKENMQLAQELPEIEKELNDNKKHLDEIKKNLNAYKEKKKNIEEIFDEEEYKQIQEQLDKLREEKASLNTTIKEAETLLEVTIKEIQDLESIESELTLLKNQIKSLNLMLTITLKIREFFDAASPKITEAIINSINLEASNHYRAIMDDPNVILRWDKDYQIYVKTTENDKEFPQLSGGEQMAAALAVRLAILKIISNAEFAFFDEPTMNLDTEKRENLAKIIQRIKGFKQFFVISHDDTFEENVDNVIKFSKNENEETTVEYLTKSDIELIFEED